MADNPLSDGIFREVDDDLKREQLENFWKEYGNTIIAAVLIMILSTAVGSFWRHYQHKKYVAQTDQLISYLEESQDLSTDERVKELTMLTQDAKGGAGTILLLQLGAQQYQDGDLDGALATYNKVEDADFDDIYTDLARLQSLRIQMEKGADVQGLIKQAQALNTDEFAFVYSARELLGLLYKKAGDIDAANKIFQNLSMNGLAPETLRQRAAAYISYDNGGQS